LRQLDYKFKFDPLKAGRSAFTTIPQIMKSVAECEAAGLLVPLILQMATEEIYVSLLGTHPLLCPAGQASQADPVVIWVPPLFDRKLARWVEGNP
jgi:hypothetical protein